MRLGNINWRLKDGTSTTPQPVVLHGTDAVRYPLIPLGTYEKEATNGQVVQFTVTPDSLREMIEHLHSGRPGPLGIPIDEDNVHEPNRDGADAWITALDIEGDWLYATIQPTSRTASVVESRPYISPKFVVGDLVEPDYGLRNFVRCAAFVSQPWWNPQPGMVIATSMSTLGDEGETDETGTVSGAAETTTGGTAMDPEQIAQLEADLEAARATITQMETDKAAADEAHVAEITARDTQIAELTTRAEAAETAQASLAERLTKIEELLGQSETEKAIAAKVAELSAIEVDETITAEDGTAFVEKRRLDPEYVQIAASAFVLKTPEAVEADHIYMAANGYRPKTVSAGSKPALQPISASAAAPPLDEAGKLEAAIGHTLTAETGALVRSHMQRMGVGFDEACEKVLNVRAR